MSYTDVVICIGPLPFLETWPPIYRGQERMVRDRLKVSQVHHHIDFRYTPCLTDFTFEFIRRPTSPILSPSYWTFVELNPRQWMLWKYYATWYLAGGSFGLNCIKPILSYIFQIKKFFKSWKGFWGEHMKSSESIPRNDIMWLSLSWTT
jgi:hypothetical protein